MKGIRSSDTRHLRLLPFRGEEDAIALRICSLASGSSGNATLVASDSTAILIDCGAPARVVERRLDALGYPAPGLAGILITHAHCDHYRSAGTLHRRHGVPVYLDRSTARALRRKGQRTSWRRIEETHPIPEAIGDLEVRAIDTPHGSPEHDGRTVAYRIDHRSRSAAVVTDLGHTPAALLRALEGVSGLILEANYDEETIRRKLADLTYAREWSNLRWTSSSRGHLSNRQCALALVEILRGPDAHVFLGHVSENHPSPRRDNNRSDLARAEVERAFARARLRPPQIHRTHRLGRIHGGPSDFIEVSTPTTVSQLELPFAP